LFVGYQINIRQISTVINAQTNQSGIFDGQYQRCILGFQDGRGMAIINSFLSSL